MDEKDYEFSISEAFVVDVDHSNEADYVYNEPVISYIKNNKGEFDNNDLQKLIVFGSAKTSGTLKAVSREFGKMDSEWIPLTLTFTSSDGQDWYSKTWKHGGKYALLMVKKNKVPKNLKTTSKI